MKYYCDRSIRCTYCSFAQPARKPLPELSPTELKVAQHVRNGLQTKEVADRMHTSVSTVENHRQAIRRKLGARKAGLSLEVVLRYYEFRA